MQKVTLCKWLETVTADKHTRVGQAYSIHTQERSPFYSTTTCLPPGHYRFKHGGGQRAPAENLTELLRFYKAHFATRKRKTGACPTQPTHTRQTRQDANNCPSAQAVPVPFFQLLCKFEFSQVGGIPVWDLSFVSRLRLLPQGNTNIADLLLFW